MENKKLILFICGHNSGRSQMAEVYFNVYNKDKNKLAISAGIGVKKDGEINPKVVELLKSKGIDILNQDKKYYPKELTKEMLDKAKEIYTMGCMKGDCNLLLGKKIDYDFQLEDPADENIDLEKLWINFENKMRKVFNNLS